jgi:hypothetical protein
MKFGVAIAVFLLAGYFVDSQYYDGKFSKAANQIAGQMATRFR